MSDQDPVLVSMLLKSEEMVNSALGKRIHTEEPLSLSEMLLLAIYNELRAQRSTTINRQS